MITHVTDRVRRDLPASHGTSKIEFSYLRIP